MEYLKYDTKNNTVSQVKFNKQVVAKTESIFSLGNGYLGIRSADEEYTSYNKEDFFVNGIFNKDHENEVPELANLADCLTMPIYINGELYEVNEDDKYLKTLHIKEGLLSREVTSSRKDIKLNFKYERFVSQDDLNVYCQRLELKVLKANNPINIKIKAGINAQVTNSGTQHFAEGLKRRLNETSLRMEQKTLLSQRLVVHNMVTKLYINNKQIPGGNDDYVVDMQRRQIFFKINNDLKEGDTLVIEKLMSVHTSVDGINDLLDDQQVYNDADKKFNQLVNSTYDELKDRSIKAMQHKVWNRFYVDIQGDELANYDMLALNFGIFHLNNFVPNNSTNKNIGAKGLSGEGYQGHTYWDTEFFINPNYLYNDIDVVRNLLTYRYKGIEGARNKAREQKERIQESNLEGAQFPWEMAWPTDGEVCPYWGQADVVTGEQVPIASRRQEIHVSADVAYAVHQYYVFSNDQEFMNQMGYEMIIDTAWFYTNRAERQEDGSYGILDVMGPNEYKGNIDNNAYINMMAKYNIDLAIKYINYLETNNQSLLDEIYNKIPYKIDKNKMIDVSNNLKQQKPNKDLIISENDSFLSLKLNNVRPFQMLGDAGKKLFSTADGRVLLSGQLVKQADVVLLLNILPHLYSKEVRKANFDYYEAITTHDSSLSAATYAIEAARLKKIDMAYKMFRYGINVDLGPAMHTSNAGIHAGSLAAIYQMIVFGFGGLDWHNDELHLDPILPKNWEKLTYRFQYKGSSFEVEINQQEFSIKTINNSKEQELVILGNKEIVNQQTKKFSIKHD
ncbi:glycosyl hydrolase family 65 protein [Mycoplasma bradburyae]|uniref:Glycoside hydrolase family 65 protein n=1 Tax=Mycoplasma bradburyae TaxID=2963128 RepID=A0ABT5GBM0_9MOLU|nr:glycosyl hydrolase family 65 protein [Mycoplasma bradburyae]MDC4182228.1 glycoside hydrolase family 65 protein [Mycoplasma bradburyae]UTS70052.1 glycoside hydrolase family 65 protein [Mycoplasma bradburyae]